MSVIRTRSVEIRCRNHWGVHVFHGRRGAHQGAVLERYLIEQFDRVAADPGDDFYGVLTKASFRGRPFSREEMFGSAAPLTLPR